MTAQKYDIEIDQGATYELTLTYRDAAGVPVPLTGYGVFMQIRDEIGGKVFSSASVANGRVTVNAAGEIHVQVPNDETAAINIERGVYDLFLHAPAGGPVLKLIYGDAIVNPSVTR